jgi:NADH-quinone oxidoreductase subunit G
MELHQDGNVIYRSVPRTNMAINRYWLCDEGRFNFRYVADPARITVPKVGGEKRTWADAVAEAKTALRGKKVAVLLGSDLTLEEAKLLQDFAAKAFPGSTLAHFGTPGITSAAQDAPADKILKRKSKTGNLHGLEKLGIRGIDAMPSGIDAALVVRGGRAILPKFEGVANVVGIGVFQESEAAGIRTILPGTSFAEKDGTIVNYEGREQRLRRAINPVGQSKALGEILMLWMHSGATVGAATGASKGMSV